MGEQAQNCRRLWAAVVLQAMDDAIRDTEAGGDGAGYFRRWCTSRDGVEVLRAAGIDPDPRAVAALVAYVARGIRTTGRDGTNHMDARVTLVGGRAKEIRPQIDRGRRVS